MGKKILRKNMVNGVNTLMQSMINDENTIYVIQYDFVLGENITVPSDCILEFDGGSISGAYTITGNNTGINAGLIKIFGLEVNFGNLYHWNIKEIYPEWFGANGQDGNTYDSTSAIQKCINLSVELKARVVLCDTWYNATTLTIQHEIQGIYGMRNTRLGALQSNEHSFIKIAQGAIVNFSYNLEINNLIISPLVNQNAMEFEAIEYNGSGGAWHWNLKNLMISVSGSGIGMYFKAVDSENNNHDVANQYNHLENVNIYKDNTNVNSRCIVFEGQVGQFTMLNCEFNGYGALLSDGDNTTDYIIEYIPRGSNDNASMPQTYINCTFQTSNNGIYGNYAHLVHIGCHFENIHYANIRTNRKLTMLGCNIANYASDTNPLRAVDTCDIYLRGTTISNGNSNLIKYEGNKIGSVDSDWGNYSYEPFTATRTTLRSQILSANSPNADILFVDNDTSGDILRLDLATRYGKTVTIINKRASYFMLYTKDGSASSNVIYPGRKWMSVEPGDTVTLIRQDNGYFRYISSSKIYPLENADYLSGVRIGEYSYNNGKKHPTWWNGSNWIDGSGSTDNERENGYPLSLINFALKSNSVIGKLFYIEEGTDDVLILDMAVPIGTEFTIINKRATYFMLYSKDGSASSNVLIPGSKWINIDVGESVTLVKEDTNLYRYIRSSRNPSLDDPSYITGARIGDMSFDNTNKKPVWFDGTQWVYADGTTV